MNLTGISTIFSPITRFFLLGVSTVISPYISLMVTWLDFWQRQARSLSSQKMLSRNWKNVLGSLRALMNHVVPRQQYPPPTYICEIRLCWKLSFEMATTRVEIVLNDTCSGWSFSGSPMVPCASGELF